MKKVTQSKVRRLVFLDGRLMREEADYTWNGEDPQFPDGVEGRVDIVDLRKDTSVTSGVIQTATPRPASEMGDRLPLRLVLSNYQSLVDCVRECPYGVELADDPKSIMIGFTCSETGDTWLIKASDLAKTGPEAALGLEFRQAMADTHNQLLKKQ